MAIYAVSTQSGAEESVADRIAKTQSIHIHSILAPSQLNSYILVESDGLKPVKKAIKDIPKANKTLGGKTSLDEALSYLDTSSEVSNVSIGDTVDIIGGPYKGQQGRVKKINEDKNQLTVELQNETIPIPVAINSDQYIA
ncbi:transcription elongation factor Spt5 [Haloquadratum walsbyi]|jgi:transcriptional antiterminator NusG|uniref:Transcription elongation factor Spt5 n=1 Tax=Haloquadratum walsbyi J07HQW2 TaxID=1238425 RepID=U1MTQ8_9EURY|nr:transcription elongation factor Spt5 [Haloquadratum walsbyi]ERG93674.1 MAG: ribosomal protein L24p/L26e, archaeal [Haloquadratum walsbyi J07HQW2]